MWMKVKDQFAESIWEMNAPALNIQAEEDHLNQFDQSSPAPRPVQWHFLVLLRYPSMGNFQDAG